MTDNVISLQAARDEKQEAERLADEELTTKRKEVDDWVFSLMDLFVIDLDEKSQKSED